MITLDELKAEFHSIKVSDGSGNDLAIDASGYITIANTSFAVTATDLDIRDLTHVSDSVKIGDGTDFLAINSDGSINTATTTAGLDSWQTSVFSATTTAAEIAATPLANRKKMIIQNLGNNDVYIGENNSVTSSNGIRLPKGASLEFEFGDGSNIWALTASSTADLRVSEHA